MISSVRKKRGEIDLNYIKTHNNLSNEQLLILLNNENPQKRTVAAKILGQRKYKEAIPELCSRLSKEGCLYTKIEISNAIIEFGTLSIKELIKYIGKVGKNQHQKLPKNIFKKKNYPLPRDIIIRTIIRLGADTLPYLKPLLLNKSPKFLSEVIDAIGYITFYSKEYSLLDDLLKIFDNSKNSEILHWKVIRAFQSFPDEKIVSRLEKVYRESNIPAHRWEAIRSLAQINNPKTKSIIKEALNDSNLKVAEMARLTLDW